MRRGLHRERRSRSGCWHACRTLNASRVATHRSHNRALHTVNRRVDSPAQNARRASSRRRPHVPEVTTQPAIQPRQTVRDTSSRSDSLQPPRRPGRVRPARRDSPNVGWRNASFRGYADYMQTAAFRRSLERSIELASQERVVLMCAEAVPWRCHRSLIADALLARGIAVSEIASGVRARPHALTPWALVTGTQVMYPGADRQVNDSSRDQCSGPHEPVGWNNPIRCRTSSSP